MSMLTLFNTDELGPVNPNAERRRNRHGERVRFRHPKGGKYHPCDSRCTQATGNDCSCACGGTQHGIHRNRTNTR